MVAPAKKAMGIKPSEFYGSSLPRPRIYTSPHFNSERVDPPLPVLDPLLSWAKDAHWSMGGLSFQRLRLQGRIEGNVSKLRKQMENQSPSNKKEADLRLPDKNKRRAFGSESPPAAPVAVKRRRRLLDLNDTDEDEGVEFDKGAVKTRRKLADDFERVATESKVRDGDGIDDDVMRVVEQLNELNKTKEKKGKKAVEESVTRTSPRLAKKRSS